MEMELQYGNFRRYDITFTADREKLYLCGDSIPDTRER